MYSTYAYVRSFSIGVSHQLFVTLAPMQFFYDETTKYLTYFTHSLPIHNLCFCLLPAIYLIDPTIIRQPHMYYVVDIGLIRNGWLGYCMYGIYKTID